MAEIVEPTLTRQDITRRCEYFGDVHLWPHLEELDPDRWLSNFRSDEEEYAVNLLQAFMYYSEELCNALFRSAFLSLSKQQILGRSSVTIADAQRWRNFVDTAIFTYVTGERPRPTDSGHAFARKARQLLGIDEERIIPPDEALQRSLLRSLPVVFVDDFVGSGDQFIHTWHRRVRLSPGHEKTFQEIVTATGSQCFYIPLVATSYGLKEIDDSCTGCSILPAHVLPPEYSAIQADSVLWPEHLRSGAAEFLKTVSDRACIPDMDGNEGDWRGFHKLALTIGFHHKVPDATLPWFTWAQKGGKPLMRGRA